jgi:hypothetical protein
METLPYHLEGQFFFEDEKEMKDFEESLINTFSMITEPCFIIYKG